MWLPRVIFCGRLNFRGLKWASMTLITIVPEGEAVCQGRDLKLSNWNDAHYNPKTF